MKFILTGLGLFLFSQMIPPFLVSAKTVTQAERVYLLENSTFDPGLRGEVSERWDFEKSNATKLENSTFDPNGEGSERWDFEKSNATKLENSTFAPDGEVSERWDSEAENTYTEESNATQLENSTFDPDGEGSERWDFEESNATKLENSTFDPNGEGSERWDLEESNAYRLEHSTFNPEYGMENASLMFRKTETPHIQIEEFQEKLRSVRPLIRSIRLNYASTRLYPLRTTYRVRILR